MASAFSEDWDKSLQYMVLYETELSASELEQKLKTDGFSSAGAYARGGVGGALSSVMQTIASDSKAKLQIDFEGKSLTDAAKEHAQMYLRHLEPMGINWELELRTPIEHRWSVTQASKLNLTFFASKDSVKRFVYDGREIKNNLVWLA